MKAVKLEPPICPQCKKKLWGVYENECWTYVFNEKTGTYKGDLVDIDILCPDCHMDLREPFPEGACNYQATSSQKLGEKCKLAKEV